MDLCGKMSTDTVTHMVELRYLMFRMQAEAALICF